MLDTYLDSLGGTFDVHVEATNFQAWLMATHPVTWQDYASFHWSAHFEQMIRQRLNAQRASARKARNRAAVVGARGNKLPGGSAVARSTYAVANDGTMKRLMAMSKQDLLFVADRYDKQADTCRLEAAFLRLLARSVKSNQVVSAAWTPLAIEQAAARVFKTNKSVTQVLNDLDLNLDIAS